MIGTVVGSYRITERISVGGMGTVYKAQHELIEKIVAVKVLHPQLRHNQDIVQRFFNEAKATTSIKHPGIVEMFDFGYDENGDGYIVMEFLEGQSLAQRLENGGAMSEGMAALMMRSVCNALAAAHIKGIIHRDLKPDNIFLCNDPETPTGVRPKILDFGIAKLELGLSGPHNATKTGSVLGTPTYMSPEQCRGKGHVDHRADFYSIGCMFYEMVCGRPPFTDMGGGELLAAHLLMEPPTPTSLGANIAAQTEALILRLLAKEPASRPQTAGELSALFATIAQGQGLVPRHTPIPGLRREPQVADANAPTLHADPPAHAPLATMKPTTLSGAASQSVVNAPRSRAGWFLGGAVVVLFAGIAAVFAARGGTSSPAAGAPSAESVTPAPLVPTTNDPIAGPAAPVADVPNAPATTAAGLPDSTTPATPADHAAAPDKAEKRNPDHAVTKAAPDKRNTPAATKTAPDKRDTPAVTKTAPDKHDTTAVTKTAPDKRDTLNAATDKRDAPSVTKGAPDRRDTTKAAPDKRDATRVGPDKRDNPDVTPPKTVAPPANPSTGSGASGPKILVETDI